MATLETLLSLPMIERLGWTLVHFVWQAAAVALLLAVVLRCLRRSSSDARYIVSCLAIVLIVTLPLLTMSLVEVSRPVAEAGPTLLSPPVMRTTPVEVVELPLEPFDAAVPEMPERVAHTPWTQRAANALEPALSWLVSGWLLGVFGLSAWHLGGWAQLQRMKRRMVRQVAEPLHAALADLANRLGVRRAVGLLESALVEVPTVVGWFKPVILLPASALSGLSTKQLEAILAHELAHVRRCDYLVNLAQTVVEILGFYHPAVWWISHRIRDERENCCDDLAVQVCGDSRRYARALTCLEELRHHSTELAVAASGGSLVARIARLLGRPPIDNRRFTWLPGLIALLVVAAILIPTALVLATPDAPPAVDTLATEPVSDAGPLEVTTQTPRIDQEQNQPKVLVSFLLFTNSMPNKTVDREMRRRIADVLAPEIPQAQEGVASMQNGTLVEILQTWVAGRLLTRHTIEVLVDVLQSRGYLQGEATPEILVNDNQPGQMRIISEELMLPAEDPASPPEPIELGTFVNVTPHVPPAPSDRITLEIGVEWKNRLGQPDPSGNPTFRSTEIASTITVLEDRYFALLAEPSGTSHSEAAPREFHLLIFRADLFEPSLTDATTPTPPARASKTLSRQIILDVQTVSVAKDSLTDGIVEWGRPQTGGWPMGIEMGYTPDQTVTDALRKHLDELHARGLARRLAHQRLTTQDGYKARFKAVKEEWFSLTPPQTQNAGAPQAEHTSIASGTIITATPTISDANNITLHLNVEFSESLPKAEGSDLPIVTRRTVRNVVTVRDGGTVLLAGLSSPYPDPTTEIAILVTARLAPEIESPVQQNHSFPSVPPPATRPVEPVLDSSISGQLTHDAAREFVHTDPVVQMFIQRITEAEIELLEAQQTFLPEHPEIVQKKQLLKALNTQLEKRHRWLEQEFQAGRTSVATPDDPARQRANAETVLAMLRQELARVDEEIDRAGSAWYPDEAERSRELEALRQYKETAERQAQEITRIIEEQFGPPAAPALAPSASEQATPDAAREFVQTDPMVREFAKRIAEIEVELLEAQQTFLPEHPEIVQKRQLLEALSRRLEERRCELQQQFSDSLAPQSSSASVAIQAADSEPSELGTVTATFEGTDLCRALDEIARQAGASIMYDASVSGDVHARLDGVSIETALRMILAGTPYVVTGMPDGYAITMRNVQPPKASSREVDAIEVEARFVLADRESIEAMQRGLPIAGVSAPADVNALHALGNDLAEARTPVLEPNQVELLLKAVRQYTASKMLAAPKVIVRDGESASMRASNQLDYISGYREPNDASQEPIAQHASKEIGMRLDAAPHLIADDRIRLQFDVEISSLLATQKAVYRDGYAYDIPSIETVTIGTEIVIPDSKTALVYAGQARSLAGEGEPAGPLLLLVKAKKWKATPAEPPPATMGGRRPGDPGMGCLPPGTNLWCGRGMPRPYASIVSVSSLRWRRSHLVLRTIMRRKSRPEWSPKKPVAATGRTASATIASIIRSTKA